MWEMKIIYQTVPLTRGWCHRSVKYLFQKCIYRYLPKSSCRLKCIMILRNGSERASSKLKVFSREGGTPERCAPGMPRYSLPLGNLSFFSARWYTRIPFRTSLQFHSEPLCSSAMHDRPDPLKDPETGNLHMLPRFIAKANLKIIRNLSESDRSRIHLKIHMWEAPEVPR